MNTKRILTGTVVGGIVFFLLGWLVYGILLRDFMTSNYNQCMNKPEMEFVWWAMIVSNLLFGAFYAVILSWSNMATLTGGLKVGAILGFLLMLSFDLSFFSMTTMYSSLSTLFIDVIAGTAFSALGAAAIGLAMGMVKNG